MSPFPIERRLTPCHFLKLRSLLIFLPPEGFEIWVYLKWTFSLFRGGSSFPVVFLHSSPSKMIEMPPLECYFIFALLLCLLLIYGSSFVSSINKGYIFFLGFISRTAWAVQNQVCFAAASTRNGAHVEGMRCRYNCNVGTGICEELLPSINNCWNMINYLGIKGNDRKDFWQK